MTDLVVILLLFFLFWGEPDIWDKLHDKAMNKLEEPQCVKQSPP
jgi:hypothetical protein